MKRSSRGETRTAVAGFTFPQAWVWAAPIALLAVHQWMYRGYVVDDAFISYRYAENWARGLGPVFNPSEQVEGYTNFLWVAWLTLAGFVGIDIALWAKLTSSVLLFACLLLTFRLLLRLDVGPALAGAGGVLLATNGPFVRNGMNGLETSLLTALCLAIMVIDDAKSVQKQEKKGGGGLVAKAVLLSALGLTRPDALLLLIALFVAEGLSNDERPWRSTSRWGPWLACAVVLVVHELWRWSFYGHPFPNTFYAKVTGQGPIALIARGTEFVAAFLPVIGGALAIPLCAAAFRGPVGVVILSAALLIGARVTFMLFSGGEYMEPFRFMAPTIPLFYILLAVATARLWKTIANRTPGWRVALIAAVPLVIANAGHAWSTRSEAARYERSLTRCHVALGQWFASHGVRGRAIAVGDVGAIGYYSGLIVIDLWGLNDAHIAHLPNPYGAKIDVNYVLGRAPAFIVLWSALPRAEYTYNSGRLAHDRAFESSAEFQRDYALIGEGMFEPGSYHLIFKRRDGAGPS